MNGGAETTCIIAAFAAVIVIYIVYSTQLDAPRHLVSKCASARVATVSGTSAATPDHEEIGAAGEMDEDKEEDVPLDPSTSVNDCNYGKWATEIHRIKDQMKQVRKDLNERVFSAAIVEIVSSRLDDYGV